MTPTCKSLPPPARSGALGSPAMPAPLDVPPLVRERASSNGVAGRRWLDDLPELVAAGRLSGNGRVMFQEGHVPHIRDHGDRSMLVVRGRPTSWRRSARSTPSRCGSGGSSNGYRPAWPTFVTSPAMVGRRFSRSPAAACGGHLGRSAQVASLLNARPQAPGQNVSGSNNSATQGIWFCHASTPNSPERPLAR